MGSTQAQGAQYAAISESSCAPTWRDVGGSRSRCTVNDRQTSMGREVYRLNGRPPPLFSTQSAPVRSHQSRDPRRGKDQYGTMTEFDDEIRSKYRTPRPVVRKMGGSNMTICSECLRWYRCSEEGRRARNAVFRGEGAAWGNGRWPAWIRHPNDRSDCCAEHYFSTTEKPGKRGRFPRGRSRAIAIRRSNYSISFGEARHEWLESQRSLFEL